MEQWLSKAGVVPVSTTTANLWLAELDESNIPKTNPSLLAHVFSKETPATSTAIATAGALRDCMGKQNVFSLCGRLAQHTGIPKPRSPHNSRKLSLAVSCNLLYQEK